MRYLLLSLFVSTAALAGDVTVYTPGGQPFSVVLNGVRMTETPAERAVLSDLDQPSYKLKIIFEDVSLGELDKNLYADPGADVTYAVKRNSKGAWALRMEATTPRTAPAASGQQTAELQMNVEGLDLQTTVTTTVSTSVSAAVAATPSPSKEAAPACSPMAGSDFETAKQSIAGKSFSDSKMTLAKQVSRSNCLTSEQVTAIVRLFDFESDRLEFAKFAYAFIADAPNFYRVNDAFEFESSIEELDSYIEGR